MVEIEGWYDHDIGAIGFRQLLRFPGINFPIHWEIPLLKDDSEQRDDPMDEDEG